MNAQTPGSNALERRNALLRAIGLASFLMILTGFGVSRYSTANFYGLLGNEQSCLAHRDSFLALKQQRDTLLSILMPLASQYEKIMVIDGKWEDAQGNNQRAILKRQINQMESELANQISLLSNESLGPLPIRVKYLYNHLLIAREAIWELRMLSVPKEDENFLIANDGLKEIRRKADNIAEALDAEKKRLQDAQAKGWFSNKKEVNAKIKNTVEELMNLAERLRSL
ncbi:MAG: hypothetical protein HUU01_13530 [Saprospiraceae bacterium]|nr:hypothetical protein [Saprospiraceae bacterium]